MSWATVRKTGDADRRAAAVMTRRCAEIGIAPVRTRTTRDEAPIQAEPFQLAARRCPPTRRIAQTASWSFERNNGARNLSVLTSPPLLNLPSVARPNIFPRQVNCNAVSWGAREIRYEPPDPSRSGYVLESGPGIEEHDLRAWIE